MDKKFGIIFLFVLLSSIVFSQNKFEYDYARFYSYPDSTGYVELYYSFYQPALKTVEIEGEKFNQGELIVSITDAATNEKIIDKNWRFDIPVDAGKENKSLTGMLRFKFDYGVYTVNIVAQDDNNPEFEESHSFDITLAPKADDNISISDIQLASGIKQDSQNKESIFYKNTLEVTPNPSLIFGDNNPVLFFYSEIYGLDNAGFDEYLIVQKLVDKENKVQYEKSRSVSDPFASIVEVGAIKVNDLNSGVYTLVVTVKDTDNHISVNSAKKIYVYNRALIDKATSFTENDSSPLESELMVLSEDELDHLFEKAEYIATEAEKEQWAKIKEPDAKKRFLARFWKKRDTDPSTPQNENKIAYYNRVNYANAHFGNVSRRQGWKTDRGRVYITYGEPSLIERFQNEYYSKPYEIWKYDSIENGVIFLFADEAGLNIYRLVHSTKRGEIYNYREYQKYVQ